MKKQPKKNVGCRGGTNLMPVSFRHLTEDQVAKIWDDYRTRFYSQEELAVKWGIKRSLLSKVVRCMPENVRLVDMSFLNRKPLRKVR